jgi:Methylamine utilisation protein MauE
VILAELLVGAGLLFKPWRSPAALLAAVLLTAFTVALAINQRYAPGVECGCWFTVTLGKASASHIIQNLILLGLALSVWLDERSIRSHDRGDLVQTAVLDLKEGGEP